MIFSHLSNTYHFVKNSKTHLSRLFAAPGVKKILVLALNTPKALCIFKTFTVFWHLVPRNNCEKYYAKVYVLGLCSNKDEHLSKAIGHCGGLHV